jgi:hypothetical protein
MLKRLLVTTALLAGLAAPASAAVIKDLGINPTSSSGAFSNQNLPTGLFNDQYTFSVLQDATFTIGSGTNVYPQISDFITNFTGAVYEIVDGIDAVIGAGDDILVLGPKTATPGNCDPGCQVFGGSAFIDAGDYYLNVSGNAGSTAGYGGDLATIASPVPESQTWLMLLCGFAGIGFMAYRRKEQFRLA